MSVEVTQQLELAQRALRQDALIKNLLDLWNIEEEEEVAVIIRQ